MTNDRFVFYRYPSGHKHIFCEEKGGDAAFHFSKFEDDNSIILLGKSIAYSTNFSYRIGASVQEEISIIGFDEYKVAFDKYQASFDRGESTKAILSRVIKHEIGDVDLHEIFNKLCDRYPSALVYVASLEEDGIWLGASPERLLLYEDGLARTVALAGTKRTNDPEDWGKKEKDEHRAVELYIEELDSDRFHMNHKSPVYLRKAGNVYHQKSDFTFSISETYILDFLKALHPTPAVCGVPKEASKKLILETEKHTRSLYTGYLGLMPRKKKGENRSFEFYVNLRCMQIIGNSAYIYVGGGITKDSKVESEWKETEDKAGTMMGVME